MVYCGAVASSSMGSTSSSGVSNATLKISPALASVCLPMASSPVFHALLYIPSPQTSYRTSLYCVGSVTPPPIVPFLLGVTSLAKMGIRSPLGSSASWNFRLMMPSLPCRGCSKVAMVPKNLVWVVRTSWLSIQMSFISLTSTASPTWLYWVESGV